MADSHLITFAHRGKADGTWDSICLRCFRTIATAPNAAWLTPKETGHTCDLLDLHVLVSDRHPYGPDTGRTIGHQAGRARNPASLPTRIATLEIDISPQ